ncbi:regulator of sigma E protease [Mobilisporobacter senegalensis]|uniref:Zinc metalloprotease n=1 Tax=Mobilisporobacter senegalensis TaxID=1329262 RepID=A0A3N1Y0N2_9FIRM|nr:RIP metalloprotease RseP [Mobilisporobacter senegalensis]ROR30807.1 regulator of sigma E protease [Mobilisporobacter senegalensis]
MNILVAIIIFSVIIIIHELGHFLLAKKNGIGVNEFSIGLGPRIASFKKGETRYSIKLLPFGGSCMMVGEDELVDADNAFNKKSVWARISVIAAGPIFNFILAFVLALFIIGNIGYDPAAVTKIDKGMSAEEAGLMVGDVITEMNGSNIDISRDIANFFQFNTITQAPVTIEYLRNGKLNTVKLNPVKTKTYQMGFYYDPSEKAAEITVIGEGMPLEAAGLKVGDIITNINGQKISTGTELNQYFQSNPLGEETVLLTYERDGMSDTVNITPKFIEESYKLGFGYNMGRVKTSPLGVLKYSAIEVKYWIVTTIKSLEQMVMGRVSKDDIAGPVGIVNIIGETYEQSKQEGILTVFLSLSYISILLSANLGVMNLLPIPALDGGRLVFLILEVFRGKPIDQEKEGLVHMIGLIALMILMVFIMFNDISRLFQ